MWSIEPLQVLTYSQCVRLGIWTVCVAGGRTQLTSRRAGRADYLQQIFILRLPVLRPPYRQSSLYRSFPYCPSSVPLVHFSFIQRIWIFTACGWILKSSSLSLSSSSYHTIPSPIPSLISARRYKLAMVTNYDKQPFISPEGILHLSFAFSSRNTATPNDHVAPITGRGYQDARGIAAANVASTQTGNVLDSI